MKRLLVSVVIVLTIKVSLNAQTVIQPLSGELPKGVIAAKAFFRVKDFNPTHTEPSGGQLSDSAAHGVQQRRAFVESHSQPPSVFHQQTIAPDGEASPADQRPANVGVKALPTSSDAGLNEAGASAPDVEPPQSDGFRWKPAIKQSLLLLAIQHGYAMTQPKTRRELKGPFFQDYFDSLKNLRGWDDGGRFFTNYLAHPLQGAATGFIQIHNDPKGMRQQFGRSKDYWTSRLKAMGWAAAMSTQFELGPISQAAIGNVGKARKLTYVDLVVTPTLGTTLLIGEDALDRFVVRWVEDKTDNFYLRIATRMLLNPSRSCANLLRFKKP
ncbi:MAG TPA: hypothetical protein VM866_03980, partial [Pyrinomonadaceae bacterium]|nr:hypothetical protein [Pyrinomonadaceae bacterium]